MMSVFDFLHVFLIWDMLSHACALSGHNSFNNHIQNAQNDKKTNSGYPITYAKKFGGANICRLAAKISYPHLKLQSLKL